MNVIEVSIQCSESGQWEDVFDVYCLLLDRIQIPLHVVKDTIDYSDSKYDFQKILNARAYNNIQST